MKPKTWSLPKFAGLQRRLNTGAATAAGILEGIWYLTATFDPVGGTVPYDPDDLRDFLGVDIEPATLVSALVEGRWLDEADGVLRVHDWDDHKPEYLNKRARQQRYRDKQTDLSGATVAPPWRDNNAPSASASASASASQETYLVQGSKSSQGEPGPPGPEMVGEKKTAKPRNGSRQSSSIRTAVTASAIADQAAAIFDACHYSGDDGGNLWGVAALMETDIGELSEAEVYSACRGAELNGRDKPKHFFACLSEAVGKRGYDLTQLLRKVNILPEWPTTKDGRRIERREKVRA